MTSPDAVIEGDYDVTTNGDYDIVDAVIGGGSYELTSTPTDADSEETTPIMRDEKLARIEIAVLATILVTALVGNGLVAGVLRSLRRRRQKLTRMNTMIAHLIVADTAVALFNVLPQVYAVKKWTYVD